MAVLIFSLTGCREEGGDTRAVVEKRNSNVVALIGEEEITRQDLEQDLKRIPEGRRETLKHKVLDDLIEARVFAREARKVGLHEDPQVMESLEKTTKETLARNFVRKHVDKKAEPSEEEQRKYYDEHMDQFVVPDGVMIREIVLKEKEQAEAVLKELKQGASFEELARKKSIARSWKTRGRLGWRFKGKMDPELENVAFGLEKGKLSDIIKIKEGYQIIKVLDKSDKRQMPFEETRPRIRTGLFREKKNDLVHKFYKQAGVDINPSEEGVLAKVGDDALTEETLAPILARVSEKEREEVRRRWINYFIEKKVFSNEARRVGLENDPEVADELKRRTDEVLANAFRKRFITDKYPISDDNLEGYYQAHLEEFKIPLRMRARSIRVKTRKEAEEILKELNEGAAFERLAMKKSIHPAAPRAGNIGWFGKGEKDPALEKVASSLEKGQISDIVKTEAGYEIIKLTNKKGGDVRSLKEVEKAIRIKLTLQRFEQERQRYYKQAGVKILGP